jgi:protein TonB
VGGALAISVAAHAAFVVLPWSGSTATGGTPSAPAVIVARLIEPAQPEALATAPPQAAAPTLPEAAAKLPVPDATAAMEPRANAPAASERPPSPVIADVPPPAKQDETRVPAAVAIRESSDSASAAALGRQDAVDERRAVAAAAAGASSGLDRGPQPLDDIEPEIPAIAGTRGGLVTLRLVISDRGAVESVEVVQSSPPGLFDAAAIAAFGHARFSPGLKAGLPVRSEVTYEVSFAPVGRGTDSSGRTY